MARPQNLVVAICMLLAAGLAFALTPRQLAADKGERIDLETLVPQSFGDWRIDSSIVPIAPNPQAQELLSKLYNQTLARTYVNSHGTRVMLSVAYGGDQSDAMQVHKPEVCYPAQGFQVLDIRDGSLETSHGTIPVRRLMARNGPRSEPVTYWIIIGNRIALGSLERKLEQLKFGLTGTVPDGLLFRVSTLTADGAEGYRVQGEFVQQMLESMDAKGRERLLGASANAG